MKQRFGLMASLSMRDLVHESRLTLCSVTALAAVLTPLILLFGMKNGLIEGLRADLIENPRTRTITNRSNRTVDEAFLTSLARRSDVAFVAPRLRTLNSEARFERPDQAGRMLPAEVVATGPGDPLLPSFAALSDTEIFASASLASRLELVAGMPLVMRVGRAKDSEVLELKLTVKGVAPAASLARDAAFMSRTTMLLVDDFLDGMLPPTATPADVKTEGRSYAGFRVHARRLQDVVTIDRDLRARDVDVETHAAEISGLLGLEHSLNLLFALLAGLGTLGFIVSLGVGLYANVERKQRELSLLRLIGLLKRNMILIPVMQATVVSIIGAVVAGLLALGVAFVLNCFPLVGEGSAAKRLCVIEPWHLVAALVASVAGAMLAASFAGRRAARILPAERLADV